jgi:uncharacterized protein (DUF4415 family)
VTNEATTSEPWIDPDEAPPLTAAWFDGADVYDGNKLVRRGRPPLEHPKRLVSLRLDPEVVERLRASGPGWQTRANAVLRKAVGL